MEIFKDVRGFEGLYRISNLGNVESIARDILSKGKLHFRSKRKILKLSTNKGYSLVCLFKDKKMLCKRVHRLVAECFIEGEQDGLVVNHKNKNRKDNRVENLEWCTNQYNSEHAIGKPVLQISLIDNTIIKEYASPSVAYRSLCIRDTSIYRACNGQQKTAGGFKWQYKN